LGHHFKTFGLLLLKNIKQGVLLHAEGAPAMPELQNHNLAAAIIKTSGFTFKQLKLRQLQRLTDFKCPL
jgi:hypothetical protein